MLTWVGALLGLVTALGAAPPVSATASAGSSTVRPAALRYFQFVDSKAEYIIGFDRDGRGWGIGTSSLGPSEFSCLTATPTERSLRIRIRWEDDDTTRYGLAITQPLPDLMLRGFRRGYANLTLAQTDTRQEARGYATMTRMMRICNGVDWVNSTP